MNNSYEMEKQAVLKLIQNWTNAEIALRLRSSRLKLLTMERRKLGWIEREIEQKTANKADRETLIRMLLKYRNRLFSFTHEIRRSEQ